jgi:glucose-1-phosphate cytidylyltransferase
MGHIEPGHLGAITLKVVILAGGFGTRISEESYLRPKPMIEIGEKPILWHIMKIYSYFGCNEFVICLGYKGYIIKEYFSQYYLHESDVTFDFRNSNQTIVHNRHAEPWVVTLINTGLETMTGGRILRIRPYIGDEPFMMTYGDGVANIDINNLLRFHRSHGKIATITSVQPGGRFGALTLEGDLVTGFKEKPDSENAWINGGFFVFQPEVFNYLKDDQTFLEKEPLENLSRDGQLMSYRHPGFWQPMDTVRDKTLLENLWQTGRAPWKLWP